MNKQLRAHPRRYATAVLLAGMTLLRASMAEEVHVKVNLTVSYFRCIRPTNVTCVAYREEDRSACQRCQEWGTVVVVRPIDAELNEDLYVETALPARDFLHDILTRLFGLTHAQADELTPPRIALLYDNPGHFGWIELKAPRQGAVMIDRHQVAFIRKDPASPLPRRRPPLTLGNFFRQPHIILDLLHPSSQNDEKLRQSQPHFLFTDDPPKTIIPRPITDVREPNPERTLPLGWNIWFESPPSPSYHPVRPLAPGGRYDLMMHLAPFEYRDQFGVHASPVAQEHLTAFARKTGAPTLHLTALLLTDETFLHVPGSLTREVLVDLRKLRRWDLEQDVPEGDPLEALAANPERNFVFAETSFRVETTGREGETEVGVSVWDNDGWPIDEVVMRVCVAQSVARAAAVCPSRKDRGSSLGGIDIARAIRHPHPAAALHFVSFGPSGVTGVFHRADAPGTYHVWKISNAEDAFLKHLSGIMDQFGVPRTTPDQLASNGERLYGTLFDATNPRNSAAIVARRAFEAFAQPYLAKVPTAGKDAPELFVRFIETGTIRRTRLIPFGLAKAGDGAEDFLGFHFRIETPLARQVTAEVSGCVSRWFMVAPPQNSALGSMRARLNACVPSWLSGSRLFETMNGKRGFRDWIWTATRDPRNAALVILSHYGSDKGIGRVAFGSNEYVTSDDVQREFLQPSIAILNGCGTGQPGAEDFMNTLNDHGFDAIIATRHSVSNDMAVDFFDCLSHFLPNPTSTPTTTLSAASFDAVQCLRARRASPTAAPYGAAALGYTIVGDSSLTLCQPRKEE
jgi:hypothetical protein